VAILSKGRVVVSGKLEEMMRAGRRFEVCTQGPVPPELRKDIEEEGHQVGGDRVELAVDDLDGVQGVIDRLRTAGCQVRRVAEVTQSLEEIFLKTLGEDAKGGAR
jgi:ABC-type multidrug transport system ATPase subunit